MSGKRSAWQQVVLLLVLVALTCLTGAWSFRSFAFWNCPCNPQYRPAPPVNESPVP